jgi:hypothetical protein
MSGDQAQFPEVAGKLVWVELSGAGENTAQGGVLVEYPEFKQVGSAVFLTGRAPNISGWLAGVEIGVRWDFVIQYMIFKSREDYDERAATHKPSLKERLVGR